MISVHGTGGVVDFLRGVNLGDGVSVGRFEETKGDGSVKTLELMTGNGVSFGEQCSKALESGQEMKANAIQIEKLTSMTKKLSTTLKQTKLELAEAKTTIAALQLSNVRKDEEIRSLKMQNEYARATVTELLGRGGKRARADSPPASDTVRPTAAADTTTAVDTTAAADTKSVDTDIAAVMKEAADALGEGAP